MRGPRSFVAQQAGAILGIVMLTILASGEEAQEPPLKIPHGCKVSEGALPEPYTGTNWAKEVIHEKTGIDLVFIPLRRMRGGCLATGGG